MPIIYGSPLSLCITGHARILDAAFRHFFPVPRLVQLIQLLLNFTRLPQHLRQGTSLFDCYRVKDHHGEGQRGEIEALQWKHQMLVKLCIFGVDKRQVF